MAKRRKPAESVSGSYTALPHAVLDSVALKGSSHTARSLLLELLRQHTGSNNGHLHLSISWLRKRGWTSNAVVQSAKAELMERELITKTRLGGLNMGPDRYALTWLEISDFRGLDITGMNYHKGAWKALDKMPEPKNIKCNSAIRNSTVPLKRIADRPSVPPNGTKKAKFSYSTIPPDRNNECLPLATGKCRQRVVGKKGRSGKKSTKIDERIPDEYSEY